jgi:hypothetical protein
MAGVVMSATGIIAACPSVEGYCANGDDKEGCGDSLLSLTLPQELKLCSASSQLFLFVLQEEKEAVWWALYRGVSEGQRWWISRSNQCSNWHT